MSPSQSAKYKVIPHCLKLHFSDYKTLNIFSFICWPSVFPLCCLNFIHFSLTVRISLVLYLVSSLVITLLSFKDTNLLSLSIYCSYFSLAANFPLGFLFLHQLSIILLTLNPEIQQVILV